MTCCTKVQNIGEFQMDHVTISYPKQKNVKDVHVRHGGNVY